MVHKAESCGNILWSRPSHDTSPKRKRGKDLPSLALRACVPEVLPRLVATDPTPDRILRVPAALGSGICLVGAHQRLGLAEQERADDPLPPRPPRRPRAGQVLA